MDVLFNAYSGTLEEALTLGSIFGIIVGVLVFTIARSDENRFRVAFGMLIAGGIVGLYNLVRVSLVLAEAYQVQFESTPGGTTAFGRLLIDGFFQTIEAGLAGALVMILLLSPIDTLKGALAGLVIGVIAALGGWFALSFTDLRPPNVLFVGIIAVLGFIFYDLVNTRV